MYERHYFMKCSCVTLLKMFIMSYLQNIRISPTTNRALSLLIPNLDLKCPRMWPKSISSTLLKQQQLLQGMFGWIIIHSCTERCTYYHPYQTRWPITTYHETRQMNQFGFYHLKAYYIVKFVFQCFKWCIFSCVPFMATIQPIDHNLSITK